MSKNQAEIRAEKYNGISKWRGPHITYRAERTGKRDGAELWSVIQYYDENPVGIAAS